MTDPDAVFGWLKALASRYLPAWLYKPVIGCAFCHAGQVSFWLEVWRWAQGSGFRFTTILCAMFGAILLEDFAAWRERKIYG